MKELADAFPEYSFRSFPEAEFAFLRVQAGHWTVEDLALPPNERAGFAGFTGRVQKFHLVAFAATPNELATALASGQAENGQAEAKQT